MLYCKRSKNKLIRTWNPQPDAQQFHPAELLSSGVDPDYTLGLNGYAGTLGQPSSRVNCFCQKSEPQFHIP